jgi:hypothetical protein
LRLLVAPPLTEAPQRSDVDMWTPSAASTVPTQTLDFRHVTYPILCTGPINAKYGNNYLGLCLSRTPSPSFMPVCFAHFFFFCFKAPYQFNIFGLTSFGWLHSIMLAHYRWC